MNFCVSSITAWWFVWRFCYIRNVLLFPTHLMGTRQLISERLSTYSWFQPGSVKFILLCKYSCIPLKETLHPMLHVCEIAKIRFLRTPVAKLLGPSIKHEECDTTVQRMQPIRGSKYKVKLSFTSSFIFDKKFTWQMLPPPPPLYEPRLAKHDSRNVILICFKTHENTWITIKLVGKHNSKAGHFYSVNKVL